jgi:chemotaxis protein CheD
VNIVVDIADLAVTDDTRATLVTRCLGSSVCLVIWDPETRVGGMIHYLLPNSSLSPEKAKIKPAMFADTGVPALFEQACTLGASQDRLVVKVVGGATLLDDNGNFNIGKQNYTKLRQILWTSGLLIDAESVGGSSSRTLCLEVGTGRVTVKDRSREIEL